MLRRPLVLEGVADILCGPRRDNFPDNPDDSTGDLDGGHMP